MGKQQQPAPPDPVVTANAQTASNKETAIAQTGLNAQNQVTPFGNLTYAETGKWSDGTPRFTATTTLTPAQQRLLETGQGTQQRLAEIGQSQSQKLGAVLADPFNTNGLPSGGTASSVTAPNYSQYSDGPTLNTTGGDGGDIQRSLGVNDYSADRSKVEQALFARLNPQIERDRAALETRLSQQGIRLGSEAYKTAFDDFERNVNDARLATVLGAGEEQNRLQSLALNAGNFGNAAQRQAYEQSLANAGFGNAAQQQMFDNRNATTGANNALADKRFANSQTLFNLRNTERNQALNERLTTRNQALNENIGLATGTQITQPGFVATPQTGVGGVDVAGIHQNAYNANLDSYNRQQSDLMGGLFGLGRAAIGVLPWSTMFSDKRLKEDIEKEGELPDGTNVYSYRYKAGGPRQTGVMAQEVEETHPETVKTHESGYRMVDYRKLLAEAVKGHGERRAA